MCVACGRRAQPGSVASPCCHRAMIMPFGSLGVVLRDRLNLHNAWGNGHGQEVPSAIKYQGTPWLSVHQMPWWAAPGNMACTLSGSQMTSMS